MHGFGPFEGTYFDGYKAGRHKVSVALTVNEDAFVITGEHKGDQTTWPLGHIRSLPETARNNQLTLTIHSDTDDERPRDPARLVLTDPDLIAWITQNCPHLTRRDVVRGSGGKIVKRLAFAVVAMIAMLFVILPRMADTLATIIPIEREIAFGKTVVAQMERFLGGTSIGALSCENPKGLAALDALVDRLTTNQSLNYDLEVKVFDHEMVNAFAAPGGQVVIMRGLLDDATGPDQVAAVLAHEIAHVESRDATRLALRAAGSAGLLAMVLGDFAGGTIAVVIGEQLLSASYTREAEADADIFAIEMLNHANISSTGMAQFFDYIQTLDRTIELPEYLSSHPASAGRAARARLNAQQQTLVIPSLSEADWQALRVICE